jgi:hypothetical protein
MKKNISHKKDIKRKRYEKPSIITYPEEAILDLIGPANTADSPDFHLPHGHAWGWRHGKGHNK